MPKNNRLKLYQVDYYINKDLDHKLVISYYSKARKGSTENIMDAAKAVAATGVNLENVVFDYNSISYVLN